MTLTARRPPAPPATGSGRLLGLDAARALAIAGMVAVNVGPASPAGLLGSLWSLPLGRASMLFMLLAGVGASLLTRRARLGQETVGRAWLLLAWRAVVLGAMGIALQALDHDVFVILPTYAVLFVLAGPLVRAPDRVLLLAAAVALVVGATATLLTSEDTLTTLEPGNDPVELLAGVLVSGPYPVLTWSCPFLLGMWLGRRDLTSAVVARRLLLLGTATAVGASVVSGLATEAFYDPVGSRGWLLVTSAAHGLMPLWVIGSVGSGAAVLGLVLELERLGGRVGRRVQPALRALSTTGQLALTIYVGHLLLLAAIRPLPLTLTGGIAITLGILAVSAVGALLWRRRFARGPLEVLLRPWWRSRTAPPHVAPAA